jgi:hypothetical protein
MHNRCGALIKTSIFPKSPKLPHYQNVRSVKFFRIQADFPSLYIHKFCSINFQRACVCEKLYPCVYRIITIGDYNRIRFIQTYLVIDYSKGCRTFGDSHLCCCEIHCFRINFIIANHNRSSHFLHLSMILIIMAFTHSFTAAVVQMI